jgi:HD-GYP domain-containing protein (c-di-GMP phosphodiesterase class II)
MKLNRNEFVSAFALALDFLEASFRKNNESNHSRRVSLLAVRLGEQLALPPEDMFDLYAAAMMHDNGITTSVYNKINNGKASSLEKSISHCLTGEANLKSFPFVVPRNGVILYHHESYDGSGYFGVSGDNIPLLAHIIHLADIVEIMYNKGIDRHSIADRIAKWKGVQFSPVLCEAFAALNANISFWLSLDNRFIPGQLAQSVPCYPMDLSLQELIPIAGIISKLIDEKSPFTGRHSQGIAEKSAIMACFYNFDEDRSAKLVMAAHLHDAGKLAVPNEVLDKPDKLTPEEFDLVRPHTFYTRRMLETIAGLEDVTEWASNHHEKLDGSGYPYGLSEKDLCFESRLMACIDIYQALTEERPYRKPLAHSEVSRIMFDMAQRQAISRDIAADVLEACR